MNFLVFKTVASQPYDDGGERMTPRLQLVLDFCEGGIHAITGQVVVRGYELTIRRSDLSDRNWCRISIGEKENPRTTIMEAEAYSFKVFADLAAGVWAGCRDKEIEQMYAQAKENWSEHQWQESILPLSSTCAADGFADGGCAYTDEELEL